MLNITKNFNQPLITVNYSSSSSPIDPDDAETVTSLLLDPKTCTDYPLSARGFRTATVYLEPRDIDLDNLSSTSYALIEKRENGLYLSFCSITDIEGNTFEERRKHKRNTPQNTAIIQLEAPHPAFQLGVKSIAGYEFDNDGFLMLPENEEEASCLFALLGELSGLAASFDAVHMETSMYRNTKSSTHTFIQSIIGELNKS